MLYKLILLMFIFQGTFFASEEFTDLEIGVSHKPTKKCSIAQSTTCQQATSSISLLSATIMHGTAAYCGFLEISHVEDINVKKALIASIIGNSAAAAGDALAAIVAPFSGKSTGKILAFTYGVSYWVANIPCWAAFGLEHSSGISNNLIASSCLGSLAIIPAFLGLSCSLAANNDGH